MNARLILLLLVLSFTDLLGQKDKDNIKLLGDTFKWSEGSILLANGEELNGLVKYNDQNGVLSYNDGDDARSISSRNVLSFDFFDEQLQKQRVFFSLEDEDSQTHDIRHLFFELIKDYETFALLLRTDRTEMKERTTTSSGTPNGFGGYTPGWTSSSVELSQSQTVCILNTKGEVLPYFKCVYVEDGKKSWINGEDVRIKNKMIDDELLSQFISQTNYSKLQRYADENKQNFKKINDFKKILEYYDTLISD